MDSRDDSGRDSLDGDETWLATAEATSGCSTNSRRNFSDPEMYAVAEAAHHVHVGGVFAGGLGRPIDRLAGLLLDHGRNRCLAGSAVQLDDGLHRFTGADGIVELAE